MLQKTEIRCPNCKKKICESYGETHLRVKCPKCKTDFEVKSNNSTIFNSIENQTVS